MQRVLCGAFLGALLRERGKKRGRQTMKPNTGINQGLCTGPLFFALFRCAHAPNKYLTAKNHLTDFIETLFVEAARRVWR